MAKVILICGKLCSGKSTYAEKLKSERNAVILSCDEITLGILDGQLGERHEELLEKIKKYLYRKAEEITAAGTDVILEFGFWTKLERIQVSKLFQNKKIEIEWHYIDITEEDWKRNIQKRNQMIQQGLSKNYFIDGNLLAKCEKSFEIPSKQEIDVWYENR